MPRALAALLLAASLITGGQLSAATTLALPASLNGTENHFFSGSTVNDYLMVSSSPVVTDLGTLSGITASLAADPGKRFVVDLPAGKTGYITFELNYHGTLGVFNSTENWTHTDSFIGLTGTAPTLWNTGVYGRANGNQIEISKTYTYTSPFSFDAWDFDVTGPFTSGGSMTYSLAQGYLSASYSDTVDGGPFFTQQAVPEPRIACLAGLGIIALLQRRRRPRSAR